LRKSEWFGGILREDQQGETAGERLSRKIGLFRRYRGKDFVLPLGIRVSRRITGYFEQGMPDITSLILPFDGNVVDWGVMLSGELTSYRQLPVWLRPEGRGSGMDGAPSSPAVDADLNRRYILLDNQDAVKDAGEWINAVRRILSAVEFRDYVELRGYSNREWMLPHTDGPDAFLVCENCLWKGLGEFHPVREKLIGSEPESESSPVKVETPGVTTIEDLCAFLQIDERHILKTLLLASEDGLVVQALIRGDRTVSIPKVENILGVKGLRTASLHNLEKAGAVAGYAGPLRNDMFRPDRIVMDQSISTGINYVAGANQVGFHLKNVRLERDFRPELIGDIATAVAGDNCGFCTSTLKTVRAFRLASWKARTDLFSLSGSGPERIAVGMGLGSLHVLPIILNMVERGYSEGILNWPEGMEPFHVFLISIRQDETADEIYRLLSDSGLSVLYDDRSVSPGTKFKDADLMGCPVRLTVSGRSMEQGGVEVFRADTKSREIHTVEDICRELLMRTVNYVNSA